MEPNYSTARHVSLHMERCDNTSCPHRSVCYHTRKEIQTGSDFNFGLKERLMLLSNQNLFISESICNHITNMHWHLLKFYKNYSITIPCTLYAPYLDSVKSQVQITIYNEVQAETFKDYQKIFLIKDEQTWEYFLTHWNLGFGTHKIYYVIDQNFMTKDILLTMTQKKVLSNGKIQIDQCFEGHVNNRACLFSTNNYIDLTYDGTLRTCPFSISGFPIPTKFFRANYFMDWEELFNIKIQNECGFSKIL